MTKILNNNKSTLDKSQNSDYVLAKSNDEDSNNLTSDGNRAIEIGGPKGPEPTRYGDWEKKGRCIDF